MGVQDITVKEWFDIKKARDRDIAEWINGVQIAKCPECGQAYSYGYEPVVDDPGACQRCRGAEGEIKQIG